MTDIIEKASSLGRKLFGLPPAVTALHPLWPDYNVWLKAAKKEFATNGRVLLVADNAEPFAPWGDAMETDIFRLNTDHLLHLTRPQYDRLVGTFDACMLLISESSLRAVDVLIEYIAPLVKPGSRIIAAVIDSSSSLEAAPLTASFVSEASRFMNRLVWIEDVRYVELTPTRLAALQRQIRLVGRGGGARDAGIAAAATLATYIANRCTRVTRDPPQLWSSVCLTLRTSERPAPYPAGVAHKAPVHRAVTPPGMRPARAALLQRPSMGRVEKSPIWKDDPNQVATALTGYRFVASLMDIQHEVGELGCANLSGPRLVLPKVRRIALFDACPIIVNDASQQFRDTARFDAGVHNILKGPLPDKVDSAYSIEAVQYFSRDDEDTAIRHLRDSLSSDHGLVVIGSPCYPPRCRQVRRNPARHSMPSIYTLPHASPESVPLQWVGDDDGSSGAAISHSVLAGELRIFDPEVAAPDAPRIYLRTPEELRALMERHFRRVFVFSMVDDAMFAGINRSAKRIFALGYGKLV